MAETRVRIDLRSLICLAKAEFLVSDRCRVVATGAHSDGRSIDVAWPNPSAQPATARKWDWVFKGDEEALHLFEGNLAEGESVALNVLVLRPEGRSDAALLPVFADVSQGYLSKVLTNVGKAIGAAAGGKVGKLTGATVGATLGAALAVMLTRVLMSEAVASILSVDGERELGSLSVWVGVRDGELKTALGLGPDVRRDGWRRGVYYPSPSKSGKTLRVVMSRSGAKYGAELQVRDITTPTPALPNGVCHIWTGDEASANPQVEDL